MMNKVLEYSCPFCGGVPYMYKEYEKVGDKLRFEYLIRCPECGATSHWHDDEDGALQEFYGMGML